MIMPELARQHMLKNQIYTNKVQDELVLAALEAIPREEFVPENLRGVAYIDEDLRLGAGRFLMEPAVFARLLQLAEIKKSEKVLVVPAATGYAVAVIAQLALEVVGLENNINLITAAQGNLNKLNIKNAAFVKAELAKGAERQKPFDLIFINGAVEIIPKTLISQLRENGRIVAIKAMPGQASGPFFGIVIHKHGNVLSEAKDFQAFTPLVHEFKQPKGFKF